LGDNWGPDAEKKLRGSTYGAINVLIDYDRKPILKTDLEIVSTTEWDLQPKVLFGTNTISCVICNLTENVLSSNPDMIKQEVLKQLGLPEPIDIRIGWGAEWNGKSWDFFTILWGSQSLWSAPILWKMSHGCDVWYDVATKHTIFEHRGSYRSISVFES